MWWLTVKGFLSGSRRIKWVSIRVCGEYLKFNINFCKIRNDINEYWYGFISYRSLATRSGWIVVWSMGYRLITNHAARQTTKLESDQTSLLLFLMTFCWQELHIPLSSGIGLVVGGLKTNANRNPKPNPNFKTNPWPRVPRLESVPRCGMMWGGQNYPAAAALN